MNTLQDIGDAFTLTKSAIGLLKSAYSLLPSGKTREDIETKVKEAELLLARGDAQLAPKLGYLLCQCTWPPQIMLRNQAEKTWTCRSCSYVKKAQVESKPTQADYF